MWDLKNGANTSDSTAISLIRMFKEGPEVSFSGCSTAACTCLRGSASLRDREQQRAP